MDVGLAGVGRVRWEELMTDHEALTELLGDTAPISFDTEPLPELQEGEADDGEDAEHETHEEKITNVHVVVLC